jgi:hypothetical protein
MNITKGALAVLATLTLTISLSAQGTQTESHTGSNKSQTANGGMNDYIVSAKSGVINLVEGEANVTRARPFAIPQMLISGDDLKPGDTVTTGSSGRVELLLSPGSFLRLGNSSQIVFQFDKGFDRVKLVRGSAVIEASAMNSSIFVETPTAKCEIISTGLYRFNVGVDGKSEVVVRKGRALVSKTTIKENRQASIVNGSALISKVDKQDLDDLDDWSKTRARTLIASNKSLSRRAMKRSAGMAFVDNAWIFDPLGRFYTFLPFTGGFSSPYGWGYSVCNPYWYRAGWNGYYGGGGWSGGNGGSGRGGGSSGSGGSGSGSGSGNSSGGHQHYNPPSQLPQMPSSPSIQGDSGRGASSGAPAHNKHP